jgi:hypothetical protein
MILCRAYPQSSEAALRPARPPGIRFLPLVDRRDRTAHPRSRHYGHADAIAVARQPVLDTAWAQNPERFTRGPQPKSLQLTDTAWINKPEPATDQPEALILAA